MSKRLTVVGQDPGSASEVCARCTRNCCSRHLPIFLMPSEEGLFVGAGEGVTVRRGARSSVAELTATCVHLDSDSRCGVYLDRPVDCRLYPLYFGGDSQRPSLLIDARCPQSYVVAEASMRLRAEALIGHYRSENMVGDYIEFLDSSHGDADDVAVTLLDLDEFYARVRAAGARGLCAELSGAGALPVEDAANIEGVLAALGGDSEDVDR